MKSGLGRRPVFHRREGRIRAHVQLCWLALLLTRVAETATGQAWRALRHELDRLRLVALATSDGTVAQCSRTTAARKQIWRDLELPEPLLCVRALALAPQEGDQWLVSPWLSNTGPRRLTPQVHKIAARCHRQCCRNRGVAWSTCAG